MFEKREERRIGQERRCYSPFHHIPERRVRKERRKVILVETIPKKFMKSDKIQEHLPEIIIL